MLITDLDLPKLDITTDEFAVDPITPHREAYKQHWLAETPAGYMLLAFEDIRDLLIKDDLLQTPKTAITQLMGAEGTIWGDWNSQLPAGASRLLGARRQGRRFCEKSTQ